MNVGEKWDFLGARFGYIIAIFAVAVGLCFLGRSESKGCLFNSCKPPSEERPLGGTYIVMDAIWKDVLGYEKYYEVSNFGAVRRKLTMVRYGRWKVEGALRVRNSKIISPATDVDGYLHCTLSKQGKTKRWSVHRIVCATFHGTPPTEKHCVNHKNGIKTDNRPENLEWCTIAENNWHSAYVLGRNVSSGGKHYGAREVFQYSKGGEFIKRWDCAADALRAIKPSANAASDKISEAANKGAGTAYGYIWRRELCDNVMLIGHRDTSGISVSVSKVGEQDRHFESILKAAAYVGVNRITAKRCAIENRKLKSGHTIKIWT